MSWRSLRLALCIPLLAVAAHSPARAQDKPDNPKAQAFFRVGAQAYDAGDYDGAILAFREAYAAAPRPGLLFSLGLCYRNRYFASGNRDDLDQAVSSLREYLALAPQGGRRQEAIDALAALVPLKNQDAASAAPGAGAETQIPTRLMISSTTPAVALEVDGVRTARVPAVVEIAAGRHQVRAHAPGYRDEERSVDIPAHSSLALSLDLQLLPSSLQVVAPSGATVLIDRKFEANAADVALPPGRHEIIVLRRGYDSATRLVTLAPGEHRSLTVPIVTSTQRKLALGSFGLGIAAAATAAVFGGLSWSADARASRLDETAHQRNLTAAELSSYNSAIARRDRFRTVSLVSVSIGVAFGGVGLGLYVLDMPELAPTH